MFKQQGLHPVFNYVNLYVEKVCPYPHKTVPDIENGSIEVNGKRLGPNGDYKPGAVVLYQCNPGFALVPLSASKRICRRGNWEGNMPTCSKCFMKMQMDSKTNILFWL